ncbi:MAG: tetratricopeptide repeat protein [Dehalococcoidia bacterium]
MPDTGALFTSKTTIPTGVRAVVPRPRLLAQLAAVPPAGVAIIRAPAGYGKTTLLRDALAALGRRHCWLSLDDWDRDVDRLLDYLSLAVTGPNAEPSSRKEPLQRLSAIVQALAGTDPAVLVLEDLHVLPPDSEALRLIDYLAQHLPLNARLLISTRVHGTLPSLSRLRLQARAIELTPEDLAFNEEEIAAFYAEVQGHPVSAGEAKRFAETTGGWAAALVLTATAAQGPSPAGDLSDFIGAEIVERLPPDSYAALVDSSVAEVLDAGLCDHLAERTDSGQMLSALEHANLPILRIGRDQYRLHALVRDYLSDQLRRDQPRFRRQHARMAHWLCQAGRGDEAVRHYAEAQDWVAACDLIQTEAPEAYKRGRWHAITGWLQGLPAAELDSRAEMRLWEARVLVRFGRCDDALQTIERCERIASSIGEPTMAELEALRSAALRIKGDNEAAVVSGRRAVASAVKGDAPLTVLAETRKQLGMALFAGGSYAAAAEELQSALEIYQRRGEVEECATLNSCIGSAVASLGRVTEASVHLQAACEQWRRLGNHKELAWTLNNLGMAHLLCGQRATAREVLVEAIERARETEYTRAEAYAVASLADLDRLSGDLRSARLEYTDAIKLAAELGEPSLRSTAVAGLACVEASSGNPVEAEALAREALAGARERHSVYDEAVARAALGLVFRQRSELPAAVEQFEQASDLLAGLGPCRERIEVLLRLAEALLTMRPRRSTLVAVLQKLVDEVQAGGSENYLATLAASHTAVLDYAAGRRLAGSFFRDLVRKSGVVQDDTPAPGDLPVVEVHSLGGFQVTVDGRPVLDIEWQSDKAKEILLLLLATGAPLKRDEIIATIWPDSGGKKGNTNFHSSLHRLRQALYPAAVLQDKGTYALNPAGVFRSDANRFRSLVEASRKTGDATDDIERLRTATDLYRGPFAAGFDSEWLEAPRATIELLFAEAAGRLTYHLLRAKDYPGVIAISERLLERDPLDEEACATLLKAAALNSDPRTGLHAYNRHAATLLAELGEQPPEYLTRLANALRTRSPRP